MWAKKQIEQHKKVADILIKIKDEAFDYLKENSRITEKEIQNLILKKFKENNLVNEVDLPIVAFGKNTAEVHYFPEENYANLCDECLVLIDIWARLDESDAPYADITWMAYKGKNPPKEILSIFNLVIGARDLAISFIQGQLEKDILPLGNVVHKIVCDFFEERDFLENFKHGTGHSLGFFDCHGESSHLNKNADSKLIINLGYTIEPGLYISENFGVRSEMNFYIDENKKLILTTPLQKEIVLV